jgi:putative peptidoglycan binding protein/N-acetylmuramoyl-L-alanine amidase-like protein
MLLEKRASFGWPTHPNVGEAPCKNGMVAHYDGSNQGLADKPHDACRTYWKKTRQFHMGPSRGWNDIGYSYGVCPHGVVFEGRGFGYAQAAQPGGNTTWTSCTFMSGPSEKPNAKQLQAWRELRAWLRAKKSLDTAVRGHRDFVSTSCPGSILYAMVKDGTLTKAPTKPAPVPAPNTSTVPAWPGRYFSYQEGQTIKYDAEVKRWQDRMGDRGWGIAADGFYGAKSKEVCIAFQAEKRLSVDGIVGPDTWKAAWTAPVS